MAEEADTAEESGTDNPRDVAEVARTDTPTAEGTPTRTLRNQTTQFRSIDGTKRTDAASDQTNIHKNFNKSNELLIEIRTKSKDQSVDRVEED